MSVLQNINGSLYRMDASDLVQLAAVDTEGILGGTPGATTNGQTLVDQLAADDVQAQTDIGQIETDLSDFEDDVDDTLHEYHVVPSKNLCPFHSQTISGIPFVADSDGYLTCSVSDTRPWTYSSANEKITLKAGTYKVRIFEKTARTSGYIGFTIHASDDTVIMENITTDLFETLLTQDGSFTLAVDTAVGIEIKVGNGAYAVEIVKSDDNTIPYEPYWVCMRDGMFPRSEQAVLAAKNRLRNDAVTQTINTVVFTVNSDKSITINGTNSSSSASAEFVIHDGSINEISSGDIFNGAIGGESGVSGMVIMYLASGYISQQDCYNNNVVLNIPSTATRYRVLAFVAKGKTVTNLVYKPMIRLASDPDDTYVPYAMTNRELTDAIRYTIANFPTTTGSSYYLHKVGRLGILTMVMVLSGVTADAWTLVGTIASGARPITAYFFACYAADTNNVVQGLLETDGSIKIKAHTGGSLNIRASVAYVIA